MDDLGTKPQTALQLHLPTTTSVRVFPPEHIARTSSIWDIVYLILAVCQVDTCLYNDGTLQFL